MAGYGDKYIEENLSEYDGNILLTDWYAGLKFLFDHSFYQGRRDDISREVERRTIKTLKEFIGENKNDPEVILNKENFPEIESRLMEVIGKGEIGRGRDIEMVISILKFISEKDERNIVKYSISKIQGGKMKDHFWELQDIRSIGPKVSSFYLRDLICFLFPGCTSTGR